MSSVDERNEDAHFLQNMPNHFIRDPFTYYRSLDDNGNETAFRQPTTDEEILGLGDPVDKLMKDPRGEHLKDHLIYRGLNLGLLSDVVLNVSDIKQFNLHRFILAQSPILRQHFEEIEYNADQIVLVDMIDKFVNMEAIEHILNRLYGNMGDHYYECKNLISLVAVCVQLGLMEWVYEYLDRALARMSSETFLDLISFSQDTVYRSVIEPPVQNMVTQYMIRYGTEINILLWSQIPVEWVVKILTDDGFIYSGPFLTDKKQDIGFCKIMLGEEFSRWTFAKDIYFSCLKLTDESLIMAEQDGSLPDHITQELLDDYAPLFDLLNSSGFHYCNMNTSQWKQIRREKFLGVSLLIRPDLIADNIFEGVYLRKNVEDANPNASNLSLAYPGDTDIPDTASRYLIPKTSKFVYLPQRPEPEELGEGSDDGSTDTAVPDPDQDSFTTIPPIRFSIVFNFNNGIGNVPLNTPIMAEPVFYAGSWWQFSIQRNRDPNETADRIQMNITRVGIPESRPKSFSSDGSWSTFSDVNYEEFTREALHGRYDPKFLDEFLERDSPQEFYPDNRKKVKAYFRIYAPSIIAGFDPEKAVVLNGRKLSKVRCPPVARTTIYESMPVVFELNTAHCILGRLLVHAIEEAKDMKEFVSDSAYFKHEVERLKAGEPIKLPKKRLNPVLEAYQHTGEVRNGLQPEPGEADYRVVWSLKERDSIWSSMRFSIVIGVV